MKKIKSVLSPYINLYANDGLYTSKEITYSYTYKQDNNIGVILRRPYKDKYFNSFNKDFEKTDIFYNIHFSNKPNCTIKQQQFYSRSNPQQKNYVFTLTILRDIEQNEELTIARRDVNKILNKFIKNKQIIDQDMYITEEQQNNKESSFGLIRSQPDYGQKKIAKQLFNNYLKYSNAVYYIYHIQK